MIEAIKRSNILALFPEIDLACNKVGVSESWRSSLPCYKTTTAWRFIGRSSPTPNNYGASVPKKTVNKDRLIEDKR